MSGRHGYDLRLRRQTEMVALARHYGIAETDDFSNFLMRWAQVRPGANDRVFALQNAARRMGGHVSEQEAEAILEEAKSTPRPRAPDGWAQAVKLDYATRQRLGITTIGAVDVGKAKRGELRKLRKRRAQERRRRERGARPQSRSLLRLQPWRKAGMSRATWYRQRPAQMRR